MKTRAGCFNFQVNGTNVSVYPRNDKIVALFIRNDGPQPCKVAWGTMADQGVSLAVGAFPFYFPFGACPTEELFCTSTDSLLEIVIVQSEEEQ